jgi:hypothetical protein
MQEKKHTQNFVEVASWQEIIWKQIRRWDNGIKMDLKQTSLDSAD